MNYYNEFDPFAAQWLRNLIDAELIPAGHVDERSIKEVTGHDLEGYTQCHFFAGIGGWSLALALADWPSDVAVWTGSCPCQPFSDAGKKRGVSDERHLWPDFFRLIAERRPSVCFGEQVASSDGLVWLDGVFADMESQDYACGAADLCAASVKSPNKRARLWWVAESDGPEFCRQSPPWKQPQHEQDGGACDVADARSERCRPRERGPGEAGSSRLHWPQPCPDGEFGGVADAADVRSAEYEHDAGERPGGSQEHAADGRRPGRLGNTSKPGLPLSERQKLPGAERQQEGRAVEQSGGAWAVRATRLLQCRDGRARRTSAQPGDEPLAYGIPLGMGRGRPRNERVAIRAARANRVGRLRGYGNAINPFVAAKFITAYMESTERSHAAEAAGGCTA